MKSYQSLKGQNKGASLIAVITAIVFVGIIGMVVTQLTITNIQMKEMEQLGKTKFYSAEEVMDDLVAGMNVKAADQMQKAYLKILSQYRTVTASDESLQTIFKKMYIQNLVDCFGAGSVGESYVNKSDDGTYEIGKYKIAVLESCFSDVEKYKENLKVVKFADNAELSSSSYRADYKNGRFVLQDIEVVVQEPGSDYYTRIHTDIVFTAPNVRFDEGNVIREFMRYSLIADQSIEATSSSRPTVGGNVYAGVGGIYGSLGSVAKFEGNTVVTRGDVTVYPGGTVTIGDQEHGRAVELWAENLKTMPFGNSDNVAKLDFYGSAYIEDDLEINAQNSEVTLAGNYYGYNFQKSYSSSNTGYNEQGPQYSSTIAINAGNANLNLLNLSNLWLAGRTYLSRSDNTVENVLLGESLSVRSSQLAYYVPENFLDLTDVNDPKLLDETGSALSEYLGVDDIGDYINLAKPAVAYHFQNLGGADVMYFLRFKGADDSVAANKFYAEYYNKNKDRMSGLANKYLDNSALKLGSIAVTLKGDILYRGNDDKLYTTDQPIAPAQWGEGGAMHTRAGIWNAKYQSLQLWLDASHEGITSASDRFTDKGNNNLFNNIINEDKFNELFGAATGSKIVWSDAAEGSTDQNAVVLVKENSLTESPYLLDASTHIKGGIIIANCDVVVATDFSGLIISKGQIRLVGTASISANEVLVSRLFADDLIRESRLFTPAFKGYEILNDENIGTVNVNKYLTYDKWSKTMEYLEVPEESETPEAPEDSE